MSDVPNGHASTEEPTLLTGANGTGPMNARERIAAELEREIAGLLRQERHLELELAEIKTDRKSFEQSLARLRDEGARRGRPPKQQQQLTRPVGVSDAIVEEIRLAIMRFVEDHDEFSQVGIRTMPDTPTDSSSKMADRVRATASRRRDSLRPQGRQPEVLPAHDSEPARRRARSAGRRRADGRDRAGRARDALRARRDQLRRGDGARRDLALGRVVCNEQTRRSRRRHEHTQRQPAAERSCSA